MEEIKYKGYVGEYQQYCDSADSKPYFAGEIPAVKQYAQVLFEGENVEELIEDFHAAVDDCISRGYLPKEKSHRITIPASLYTKLSTVAKQNGVSVTSYINHALASLVL